LFTSRIKSEKQKKTPLLATPLAEITFPFENNIMTEPEALRPGGMSCATISES
jgi:hypothetical protein